MPIRQLGRSQKERKATSRGFSIPRKNLIRNLRAAGLIESMIQVSHNGKCPKIEANYDTDSAYISRTNCLLL